MSETLYFHEIVNAVRCDISTTYKLNDTIVSTYDSIINELPDKILNKPVNTYHMCISTLQESMMYLPAKELILLQQYFNMICSIIQNIYHTLL